MIGYCREGRGCIGDDDDFTVASVIAGEGHEGADRRNTFALKEGNVNTGSDTRVNTNGSGGVDESVDDVDLIIPCLPKQIGKRSCRDETSLQEGCVERAKKDAKKLRTRIMSVGAQATLAIM